MFPPKIGEFWKNKKIKSFTKFLIVWPKHYGKPDQQFWKSLNFPSQKAALDLLLKPIYGNKYKILQWESIIFLFKKIKE